MISFEVGSPNVTRRTGRICRNTHWGNRLIPGKRYGKAGIKYISFHHLKPCNNIGMGEEKIYYHGAGVDKNKSTGMNTTGWEPQKEKLAILLIQSISLTTAVVMAVDVE